MEKFVNKFTYLLRYVPYLMEEKEKIQRFLNCLCHQQFKIKSEGGKLSKNNYGGRTGEVMKKKKPPYLRSFGRDPQNKKGNIEETLLSAQPHTGSRVTEQNNKNYDTTKEPLMCWWCGGPHTMRDYPHSSRSMHNIQTV